MNDMNIKLSVTGERGITFSVTLAQVLAIMMLLSCNSDELADAMRTDSTVKLDHVPGRPDLDIRTSPEIAGFVSAVRRPDGAVVTYDRISGSGQIEAEAIIIEGELSPGNSPGCVNFDGDVTFNTFSTLLIEIGGTTVCTGYDQVSIANALTINSATLQVVLINDFAPSLGQRFDVLDWGSISGTFGFIDLSAATLTGNLFWDTSFVHTTGELVVGSPDDSDTDGVLDYLDNCTLVINPAQRDTDNDGFGNFCDPDFNNDLIVNAPDLAFFKTKFFTPDPDADLNGNGIVNAADLAIFKTFFFRPPGPSGLVP